MSGLQIIRFHHPEQQDATLLARVVHADGTYFDQGHFHTNAGEGKWRLEFYDKSAERPGVPIFVDDDAGNTAANSPIIVTAGGALVNDGYWDVDDTGYNFLGLAPHFDDQGTLITPTGFTGADLPFQVGDQVAQGSITGYVESVDATTLRLTGGPWATGTDIVAVSRICTATMAAGTVGASTASWRGGRTYRVVVTLRTADSEGANAGTKGNVGSTKVVFEGAVDTASP